MISVKSIPWGRMVDGRVVSLFTLANENKTEVSVTDYGATVVSLRVPDRFGRSEDVVLGYDDLSGYLAGREYFGAAIGRYANRIAHGRFVLDGQIYSLSKNERGNTLHGGLCGLDKRLWTAHVHPEQSGSIEFGLLSHDGDEGFPGNLLVRTIYTLLETSELRIDYYAESDRKTVLNLTNHSYFNLSGPENGNVLDHELSINADYFLPCDEFMIPTGEKRPVADSPFDFRSAIPIGARIKDKDRQLEIANGYDHNWIVNGSEGSGITLVAKVYEPRTGRTMEVLTTEPGVQFYSGNHLNGGPGRDQRFYFANDGFCLETQHFPDSPNKPQFPSVILSPGALFHSTTIFRFLTDAQSC